MEKAKPLLVIMNGAARASDSSYGSAELARRFEDESGRRGGARSGTGPASDVHSCGR